MARHHFGDSVGIGNGKALKPLDMRVEHAGSEEARATNMPEQARDDVGIVDEVGEQRCRLQALQRFAERPRQRAGPSRELVQRPCRYEIDDGESGGLVDVMDARREASLGGNPHRFVLVRIAQRAGRAFHAQQIGSPAHVDAPGEGAGRPAGHRRDGIDARRAERGPQGVMHRLALHCRQRRQRVAGHGNRFPDTRR
ncbi:MAG: hypothetical protein AB7F36_17145 [Reyranellaceae bacterium]